MNNDPELERWQSLWQTDGRIPPDLRERAMRQVRRMRILLIGDIAVTVIIGGGATLWGLSSSQPFIRLLTAWIWFTIIAAWIFRFFNHRGNWTGLAPSTDAFFEMWVKRCRENRRNLIFGIALGALQFTFCGFWINWELHQTRGISLRQFATAAPMDIAYVFAAGLLIWALWLFRKVTSELHYVERLKDEWTAGETVSGDVPERPARVPKSRFIEAIIVFRRHLEALDLQHRRRRNRIKFPAQ